MPSRYSSPAVRDLATGSPRGACHPGPFDKNNYRGNGGNDTGEVTSDCFETNNGVFVAGRRVNIDQILDGACNTALYSEGVLGDVNNNVISVPGDWFAISPASPSRNALFADSQNTTPSAGAGVQYAYAGNTFVSGDHTTSRYNHILPPNAISVVVVTSNNDLAASINSRAQATTASSRHPGGANLVLADGSVRFVKSEIGIQIWQGLGSIAGGEQPPDNFQVNSARPLLCRPKPTPAAGPKRAGRW
jgi:prepilin-type processing-associated H-X9-DG protein